MTTYYVKTTGNDSTGDGSSGNPWATPGKAAAVVTTALDRIALQSGTYTLSTSTPGAGGPVVLSKGVILEGYAVTAGDLGTPPVIDAGSIGSITIVKVQDDSGGSASSLAVNVIADGNSQSSVIGFEKINNYNGGIGYLLTARDCTYGFSSGVSTNWSRCTSSGCDIGFNNSGPGLRATYCLSWLDDIGFYDNGSGSDLVGCIAGFSTGAGISLGYNARATACVAYRCGSHGISFDSAAQYPLKSYYYNISWSNGGYGFNVHSSGNGLFHHNASGGNTSGHYSTTPANNYGAITLTENPFIDGDNGNFGLNNAAGGGALLRAVSLALGSTNIGPFNPLIDIPTPAEVAAAIWAYGHRSLT